MSDRSHLEGLFRQIVEASPHVMVMVSTSGRIEMANARIEPVFGYARNEIPGQPIEILVPERFRGHHRELRMAFSANPPPGLISEARDLPCLRKDGSEFSADIRLSPIQTDYGPMTLATVVDITQRKEEAERLKESLRELKEALRERDILLGEIHHRVYNNLQIVYSMLDLEADGVSDPSALDQLRDSLNRVRSMALIHQTLYGSNSFAEVDFALFLDVLLPVLTASYGIDPGKIHVRINVEAVRLPIRTAVPCGLIANELLSNAFKHAFPNRDHGEVNIELIMRSDNECVLTVSDDGVGLPDDAGAMQNTTLGLQLVSLLANQIKGSIEIHRSNPTRFSVRFPI
ncbi:MAG: histidine kinase dimerization/phosphoacceptor domain -containing protein [Acetobacteraceae bacterium]|jgi:PAS domain S-box-containing protein